VAIGPLTSPTAPDAAAAPGANAVAGQVPTPTPAPSESTVQVVPFQITTTQIVPSTGPQPSNPSIQLPTLEETRVAGCTSPDFIFQGCPLAPQRGPGAERFQEAERRLEARAITSVLQQYQLPESERPRVLRYARPEVRAALFADLEEAFQTLPAERSPDYQLLVDVYTPLTRNSLTRAAQAAQDEYQRWRANPCDFRPPPGFSYQLGQGACVGASRAFTPESPGIDAFVAYGVKRAYADTSVDDPRASAVAWATSSAAVLGYGTAATGLAAVGGAVAPLPQSALTAIFPYAFRAAMDVGGAGAAGAGLSAAATTAGLFAIIVATVSTAVTGSLSIAREAEIPGRLEAGVNYFRNFDVETTVRNCNYPTMCISNTSRDTRADADRALYANFMLTTLPDYPGTEPAPAAQPGDPQLVVAGSPVDWLRYKADDRAGSPRAARLSSGPWFVDKPDGAGDGEARLTLSISYRDAGGATWTARRVGNQFLIARTGIAPNREGYVEPRLSPDLSVVDPSGRTVTARMGG
jgi:hypothetical protein